MGNLKLFGLDKCETIDLVVIICDVPNVWKIVYMLIDRKTTICTPIDISVIILALKLTRVIPYGTNSAFEIRLENNRF